MTFLMCVYVSMACVFFCVANPEKCSFLYTVFISLAWPLFMIHCAFLSVVVGVPPDEE